MKIIKNNLIFKITILFFVFSFFSTVAYADLFNIEKTLMNIPTIEIANEGFATRVAPGEFLPISVKVLNFGGTKRVDAIITYQILDNQEQEIYISKDTVAIETTASFVKLGQIPSNATPGLYTAKAFIVYENQITPAETEFSFKVEKKIFGLFLSDFYRYSLFFIPVCIFLILLGSIIIKRRNRSRFSSYDYSVVPMDKRVFFELISDTIMSMRQRVGDQALEIAKGVDGLKIDEQTGRVLELSDSPSRVIALLVARYEDILGKKVSFSFRR